MANYLLNTVKEAVVKDGAEVSPKVLEIVQLVDAVDEAGVSVKVRGQKMQATAAQIDQRVAVLETELAKWKSIQVDANK